jgi:rRNA maturation endonuclease Nob1
MRLYKTAMGKEQYQPSLEEAVDMDSNCQGFCLACGETQDGVEPDAAKHVCDSCGKPKVYGAAELLLMELVY